MSTPWQPSNCLKELILDTCSWKHAVIEVASGMGCRQEDVEWSNRQSENSSGSSFHLFVCSQAVFSPVKTKFNLHPFIHCYSPLSAAAAATPTPQSIICFYFTLARSLPFFSLISPVFRISYHSISHISRTCSKKKNFQFHFVGLRHSFLTEHCANLFCI